MISKVPQNQINMLKAKQAAQAEILKYSTNEKQQENIRTEMLNRQSELERLKNK